MRGGCVFLCEEGVSCFVRRVFLAIGGGCVLQCQENLSVYVELSSADNFCFNHFKMKYDYLEPCVLAMDFRKLNI